MQPPWKARSSVSITFSNGQSAPVVQVQQKDDIPAALQTLGLPCRPTLVLIGGASHISPPDFDRIQRLFIEVLVPFAESYGAIVVDGGTDAGVMQLMGQARSQLAATFPLVGVCPIQLVQGAHQLNQSQANQGSASAHLLLDPTACLEPHHTHFMLVPGCEWGDESSWLAWIASSLSGALPGALSGALSGSLSSGRGHPSIAVLVNGGKVSLIDVQWNIIENRSIAVVAGSGRLADEIAAAIRHPETTMRDAIALVVQSGQFKVLELSAPSSEIETFLQHQFSDHAPDQSLNMVRQRISMSSQEESLTFDL